MQYGVLAIPPKMEVADLTNRGRSSPDRVLRRRLHLSRLSHLREPGPDDRF
jgi:hypothetical protein